jgi:iron-sulfur cluster repair protein YtfE (RIC family)
MPPATPESPKLSAAQTVSWVIAEHASLRDTLAGLQIQAEQLAEREGHRWPRLKELCWDLADLRELLAMHTDEERRALLGSFAADPKGGSAAALRQDHEALRDVLADVRLSGEDYQAPARATPGHAELYLELEALERRLLRCMQLEDRFVLPARATG